MTIKKHILIITYYWPPSGGPAVQRWLSYSAYLKKAGFEVSILTVDENYASFPSIDLSLNTQIEEGINVYKTKTKEVFNLYKKTIGRGQVPSSAFANESNPGPLKKIARFIRGNFFIPDARKAWNKYALPKAKQIIYDHKVDVVITAGPPHSTHLMGLKIKKAFPHIYWIADFHDAWTDIIFYKELFHTKIAALIDASLEKKVLDKSDHVLTVGENWIQKFCSKSVNLKPSKFHILRMAFDENKFLDSTPKHREPKNHLTFAYTGTISDNYHPEVFIDALVAIKLEHPAFDFTLQFAGILAENIRTYIIKAGLEKNLQELGYLPHSQSIQLLKSADVLLLVNPKIEQEDMVIPGKIYEYLAAKRVIINITNKTCETANLIKFCDSGDTFERNETDRLKNYIYKIWLNQSEHTFIKENIYSFSKDKQSSSFISFLREIN
jgi:glycosyltransferase involved in cell wall biosynthesis